MLVAVWAATGVALGVRRRQDRLGPIVLAASVAAGVLCLAQALVASADTTNDLAAVAVRLAARTAPGVRPPPVRRLARRSTDERRPASRRGRRLCRQPHHRCSTVHRPRLDPRLADRDAVGGRVLRRRSRRLLPLSERRGHRPSPDPVARVGAHRGGRGHPRDDGAAAAHRVAARPRHRGARDDRARPDRDHRRHAPEDGRTGRPAAHSHDRPHRSHRAHPGRLRDRRARSRTHPTGQRAVAAAAVDGGRGDRCAAVPPRPELADRAGQPARLRSPGRPRRDAAHVRSAPHPLDPARRTAPAVGREPAQLDGAGVGRGLDRSGRPVRTRGGRAAPPAPTGRHRPEGTSRSSPAPG